MDWDYVIVGSGFGGSVCGLRLTEKGYHVLILEKGRRFRAEDFPHTNWNLRRWLWLPALGCRGIFKMTFLRHVTVLSGVGVGGGSLVYANTLPTPKDDFFAAPSWGHLADWKRELEPHYATAFRMLGVTQYPHETYSTRCCAMSPGTSAGPISSGRRAWQSTSASRARRCPTRTSAAKGQTAPAASNAARA